MTKRTIILSLVLLGLLSACGDDSDDGTVQTTVPPQATTPTTASGGSGIADAAKTRDDLLAATATAIKGKNLETENKAAADAVAAAWKTRLPGVVISGYGVESKPGPPPSVSSTLLLGISAANSKDSEGPANPYQVVFVVKDTAGKCAGGALRGFPTPTQEKRFDLTGPCSASAVPESSLR